MHEAKCVNKHWWILKMHYKRQTAVLSVMFVLVGMMFLVPAITGKAMAQLIARADGKCGTTPCNLTITGYHLWNGKWVKIPTRDGIYVRWSASRAPSIGEPNLGINGFVDVTATAIPGAPGKVYATFNFRSPIIGPNECSITISWPSPPVQHKACDKGSGINPKYFYYFVVPSTASGSGGSNSGSDSGDDNGEDSGGDNGDNGNGN
jgi:hypothetical protein